jgi:hypothetical protein
MRGRFSSIVHDAVEQAYGSGFPEGVFSALVRGISSDRWSLFFLFLRVAGVDYGPHILHCLNSSEVRQEEVVAWLGHPIDIVHVDGTVIRGRFRTSRYLDDQARGSGTALSIIVAIWDVSDGMGRQIGSQELPWSAASRTSEQTSIEVTLEIELRCHALVSEGNLAGIVYLNPRPAESAPGRPLLPASSESS